MRVYDYTATNLDGSEAPLSAYKGDVLLVVNTATGCGFTPQYEDLEKIYANHRTKGFEILDFPCNQFREQAPGSDEEIHQFCTMKFGTEFPQFKKIDVNGENAFPLFKEMATEKPFVGFGRDPKALMMNQLAKSVDKEFGDATYIKWNFTKFLIDRAGNVVRRFEPTADVDAVVRPAVEELL